MNWCRTLGLTILFLISVSAVEVYHATTRKGGTRGENDGSTQGETHLWINGRDFPRSPHSRDIAGLPLVSIELVRDYSVYYCRLSNEQSTSSLISCYTPALPEGSYDVKIRISGESIPGGQYKDPYYSKFRSILYRTPIINNIISAVGLPRRMIEILGDFKTSYSTLDEITFQKDSKSFISRINIGIHQCNLINPTTNNLYSSVTNNRLQCLFESNDVGIFNVTLLVTNGYGLSKVESYLYRFSGAGQPYNFESYPVLSTISPQTGNALGGQVLTLHGLYFGGSSGHPLTVNVNNRPCEVLNFNSTMIQCRMSKRKSEDQTHHRGGRGWHVFREQIFVDLNSANRSSPPLPSTNATRSWIGDASYSIQSGSPVTIWLIGYIRPSITSRFRFQLLTNSLARLYLSSDEDPNHVSLIADNTATTSNDFLLKNNTDYYMVCVCSRNTGNLQVAIMTIILDSNQQSKQFSNSVAERQTLVIGSNPVVEHQRIVYSQNISTTSVGEVQEFPAILNIFQVGFRGVYTAMMEAPSAEDLEEALNDLPTIYPLRVTVTVPYSSYLVTFPNDMGDVPLLTIISDGLSEPLNSTEKVKGVPTGSKLGFELDGSTTRMINIEQTDQDTQSTLQYEFDRLFRFQCPPSLYDRVSTSSIVYSDDFESSNIYVSTDAFCGRRSVNSYYSLVNNNYNIATHFCFAYKTSTSNSIRFEMRVETDDDLIGSTTKIITMTIIADGLWHYKCIDLRRTIEALDQYFFVVERFFIPKIVCYYCGSNILFDTVTLRTSLPFGYEEDWLVNSSDQSQANDCRFPFNYRGRTYWKCTIDGNYLPICMTSSNEIRYCQRSSIEGVRRFHPTQTLLNDEIRVSHNSQTKTIDVSFSYKNCKSPSMIQTFPSTQASVVSITRASEMVTGVFDAAYMNHTFKSIPVGISTADLQNTLQASPNMGYVDLTREASCSKYSYRISWIEPGPRELISIIDTNLVRPIGTPINVIKTQSGSINLAFYHLPRDIMRTYHTTPQVEVIVNGYAAFCNGTGNDCGFTPSNFSIPVVRSIQQQNSQLTIEGDGFESSINQNTVLIGEQELCMITEASINRIVCQIVAGSCGQKSVDVLVSGKGFASSSTVSYINVPLIISSIFPEQGGVGGGYRLTVYGSGFSATSSISIDGNSCGDVQWINSSLISCLVPASSILTDTQVTVRISDTNCSSASLTRFTYNINNIPVINGIQPSFVTVSGGLVNISGSGFQGINLTVIVGSANAKIIILTANLIQIQAPKLAPGRYPVIVNTSLGFGRPIIQLDYQFYIQTISRQVGSIYGGLALSIYGFGFIHNETQIRLRSETNYVVPCQIISMSLDQVDCLTGNMGKRAVVEPTGSHPQYQVGFEWTPKFLVVEQGTIVTWRWNASAISKLLTYRVQQLSSSYATGPMVNGFDSGPASSIGSFSHQFNSLGEYYYWSPNLTPASNSISIRGVIQVIPARGVLFTVEATYDDFTAQKCVFPFTYNSINYTECTNVNDTRLWCSPTSIFSGQRIYCYTGVSFSNATCLAQPLDGNICNESIPTMISSTTFLATTCDVESIDSIDPTTGFAGTVLKITGTHFRGNICEYEVEIGSFYRCPVINVTSTQIMCRITNGSMLNIAPKHSIRVLRRGQGYLRTAVPLEFVFQPSIFSISPVTGSIFGGTEVTIEGDGFSPKSTFVVIANQNYENNFINVTNSRITFTTRAIDTYDYRDLNHTLNVGVHGLSYSVCRRSSCSFMWRTAATTFFESINPSSVSGPTNLTIIGRNLPSGSDAMLKIDLSINNHPCQVISITNESVLCSIESLEWGSYPLIGLIKDVGYAESNSYVTSVLNLQSVSPTVSSIYGGLLLLIRGNGFSNNPDNVMVMIGSASCSILQSKSDEIQCITPPQPTDVDSTLVSIRVFNTELLSSFSIHYNASITPNIASVESYTVNGSTRLNITGSNFVHQNTSVLVGQSSCNIISIFNENIVCNLGSAVPAGNHQIIIQVNNLGYSNSNFSYNRTLIVDNVSPNQGSFGGGLNITVMGDGLAGRNISIDICNQSCQPIEVESNTRLTCITPANFNQTTDQRCDVIVVVNGISRTGSFTYRTNLTSTITDITPKRGGTGGGTAVTIIGTGFPTATNSVLVTINNIACRIQNVNQTVINCLTGPSRRGNLRAAVRVWIIDQGYAISSVLFQYIDLWSSRWTWEGQPPPEEGTIVSVERGIELYLDISTPKLKVLIIDNATLIFEDSQDITLNVEYILIVNKGRLQIGTEHEPFQHRAIIMLYGDSESTELPIYGAKVLGVREGILDMHGKSSNTTWTYLDATAENGSSSIVVVDPIDWSLDSEIVIATTGDRFSQYQSEVRRITNISSDRRTLTLNKPLTFKHIGIIQQFNETSIAIRAEVGLLSHNVLIKGFLEQGSNTCGAGSTTNQNISSTITCQTEENSEEDETSQFGATILVSRDPDIAYDREPIIIRISNVEMYNMGQSGRLTRHPINFDRNNRMASSYIRKSSIHMSYNRIISIQVSDAITIENNVFYNVRGTGISLETGTEINNKFIGNLMISLKASSKLAQDDVMPAAFLITNPNNILENNAVVGISHFGYWYRLTNHLTGVLFGQSPTAVPFRQPLGRFLRNSVHSSGLYGLWIYPYYYPTVTGGQNDRQPNQAVFDGLVSWKNEKGMEWIGSITIRLDNAVVFDNADVGIACISGFGYHDLNADLIKPTWYDVQKGSAITNSIIIGDSNTSDQPISPSSAGLILIQDRGFLIDNVTFINFPSNQTKAIQGTTIDNGCVGICGGWFIKFSQMNFINVAQRALFRWKYESVFEDMDGSLGGQNRSIIMAYDRISSAINSCELAVEFNNGIRCSTSSNKWIRFEIRFPPCYYGSAFSCNRGRMTISRRQNASETNSWFRDSLKNSDGYMAVLKLNETYELSFESVNDWYRIDYSLTMYDMPPGGYFIIQHRLNRRPYGLLSFRSQEPLSGENSTHNQWYYDESNGLYSYIIKKSPTDESINDMSHYFAIARCPCTDCECPTETSTTTETTTTETTTTVTVPTTVPPECQPNTPKYWSNDEHWTYPQDYPNWNRTKPGNDRNIHIHECVYMIIDHPLPRIHTLTIDGRLEFQQGRSHTMHANRIVINRGKLLAGSFSNSFNGTIDIFLNNNIQVPESRKIDVFGELKLHGASHNVIWTKLSRTAEAGVNIIYLNSPVDWSIDDEIILTTTDKNLGHTERNRIARLLNRTTLLLTNPIAYKHVAISHTFPGGRSVAIAAAVGLLTRNIRVISNDGDTQKQGFQIQIAYRFPYKGYSELKNVQFIGFGRYFDSARDDQSGIFLNGLLYPDSRGPTYVDSCSFENGFNAATYRSGIIVTGRNNYIVNNLVTSVYWLGTAKSKSIAAYDYNYDAAIMTRNVTSVIMRNNLIVGAERLGYFIDGDACSPFTNPFNLINYYSNNEAYSVMSGVNMWPTTRGFIYDRSCILIRSFTVYNAWYYGFYINVARNITLDSCVSVDNQVGIYTYIIGQSPQTKLTYPNQVTVKNSIIIGSIVDENCTDQIDRNSSNIEFSTEAEPQVARNTTSNVIVGRIGITFPIISGGANRMPFGSWTANLNYPSLHGGMSVHNTILAFFNDICNRHDVAFQVAANNDYGQFPITTTLTSQYNVSSGNVVYNPPPDYSKASTLTCGVTPCDGLRKSLLTDSDGTLFNLTTSVFSWAEAGWGSILYKIGDFNLNNVNPFISSHGFNLNITHPYRGISRTNDTCELEYPWRMYRCKNDSNYRMLMIESLDDSNSVRRLNPVAILSDNGFIDILTAPRISDSCGRPPCPIVFRYSAIVQSGRNYTIYFDSTPPSQMRFRLIDADNNFKCIIGIFFGPVRHVDVYKDDQYQYPTNHDPRATRLLLQDIPNNVTLSSPIGANFFNARQKTAFFLIGGNAFIVLKLPPTIFINFGLPFLTPNEFYREDIAFRIALLLNIDVSKIRRTNPISESQEGGKRHRRQNGMSRLLVEIRDEPQRALTQRSDIRDRIMFNIGSYMIDRFQTKELMDDWISLNITNGKAPATAIVQQPLDEQLLNLRVFHRFELVTPPSECREQTPCGIQPVLVAYDPDGEVIENLGSKDRPWQVEAIILNQSNSALPAALTTYFGNQTQFTNFYFPIIGSFQVEFRLLKPEDSSSSTFSRLNHTVISGSIVVTSAIVDAEQVNPVYQVNINQRFRVSMRLIDRFTRVRLQNLRWGSWTWKANVSLYQLPKFGRNGILIYNESSSLIIDEVNQVINITNLTITGSGMYMLKLNLFSTNQEHQISIVSKAFLVKSNVSNSYEESLEWSNITFIGDYDVLNLSNKLELTKAMLYNYLVDIGMPIATDISLENGSVVALFRVYVDSVAISRAVTTLFEDTNALPDLTLKSINMNGRTQSRILDVTVNNPSSPQSNNTGLIVGLVIGFVVLFLVVGIVGFIYRKRRSSVHSPTPELRNPGEKMPLAVRLSNYFGIRPGRYTQSVLRSNANQTSFELKDDFHDLY